MPPAQAGKPALRARAFPVQLTHHERKQLWWRAQRMSFAAYKNLKLKHMTRRDWARIIYRVLIRHPEKTC